MSGAIPPLSRLPHLFLKFDPMSVGIGFVVGEVALGWISLRILPFSAVGIIPPVLCTHSFVTDMQQLTSSLSKHT